MSLILFAVCIYDFHCFVSYLYTDDASPAAAVLAFINCLIATAECIEAQDSPHAVPNEAHLQRPRVRHLVIKIIIIFMTYTL